MSNINDVQQKGQRKAKWQDLYPELSLKKKYNMIVMDPPWQYNNPKVYEGIKPKYPTLTLDQLKQFPMQHISDRDSILLMWTTSPMAQKAMELMNHYGYDVITTFAYWEKHKNGKLVSLPGSHTRSCMEQVLVGTKGKIEKYKTKEEVHQLIRAEVMGHSYKPSRQLFEKIQKKYKIEQMNCLEVFARSQTMEGFDTYGNEMQPNFQTARQKAKEPNYGHNLFPFCPEDSKKKLGTYQEQSTQHPINHLQREERQRERKIMKEIKCQEKYLKYLQPLAKKFPHVFAFTKQEIGKTQVVQHQIRLEPDVKPIIQKPYRMTPQEEQFLKKEIEMLLLLDCIEAIPSDWASPVIFVKKKDTKDLRMCIDFRKLNSYMKPEIYPIPRIDDIISRLQGSNFFTKLDLKSGFWQIEICEEDRHYTAFTCPLGTFQWKRMPFGLKNAPATFQRAMERVLAPYLRKFAMVYIDDIIIYSKTAEEHQKHIELIFQALQKANLTVSLEKCEFYQDSIKLLGHEVSGKGFKPLKDKVEAIERIPIPINKKKLRSFLGLANYYRVFIKDFSRIAQPLYGLLKNEVQFIWNKECNEAFEKLKQVLCKEPVLGLPQDEKPLILYTDFSEEGLGAILSQQVNLDKPPMVLEYASRSLRGAELNYPAYEGEVLAVHWAFEKFRHYLLGRPFTLVTDNKALQSILTSEKKSKKIIRWLLEIQEYTYEAIHRPGTQHQNADGLSRLQPDIITINNIFHFEGIPDIPCEKCQELTPSRNNDIILCECCGGGYHQHCHEPKVMSIPEDNWYCSNCLQTYKGMDVTMDFNLLHYLKMREMKSEWDTLEQQRIQQLAQVYSIKGKHMYMYAPSFGFRLIPTLAERTTLVQEQHSLLGHPSNERLQQILRQTYYWPKMNSIIQSVTQQCATCAARSLKQHLPTTYSPSDKGWYPFHTVSVDLAMTYPITKKGNKNIAVCIDNFSKWIEIKPIPDKKSSTIAQWFWQEVICRYGCPKYVRSDNGGEFKGEFLQLLENCSITPINTSSYYPRSNGMVERMIGTIKRQIKAYVNDPLQNLEWDDALIPIAMAIRTAIARAIDASPYQVLFGRNMNIPTAVMYDISQEQYIEPTTQEFKQLIQQNKENFKLIRDQVIKNLNKTDKFNKEKYESKGDRPDPYEFKEGQLIFLRRLSTSKLDLPSKGPFIFESYATRDKMLAWIHNPVTNTTTKQHISNILPWKILSDTHEDEEQI